MEWRQEGSLRWLETGLGTARAAFSTRLGGVSEGDFESLNLGVLTDDEESSVRDNRARLTAAIGIDPHRVVIGRQVHGGDVARLEGPQDPTPWAAAGSDPPLVDGHVSAESNLALLVFVADCLPVALFGEGGVAMLHCGWRGLAAGIAGRGADAVSATHAAIGPGIGPCCYEVGDEVLAAFAPLGPGLAQGSMLDLPAVARVLLERAGVGAIEAAGLCTRCNPELFFSHRGSGGRTGRQAGLVWREAA